MRRERFDVIRAAEWIDDVRHSRLIREQLLRAKRDLNGLFCRQRERLVHRIRMQRLSSAEYCCHSLVGNADDIVHRLLRSKRHAGGLRVKAHHERAGIFRAVSLLHVPRPNATRSTKLCDLLEKIVVDVPEERKPRRERIDVEASRNSPLDVSESIGESERELLRGRRSRFANMVAGNRNSIPLRNVSCGPLEAIDDQSERWLNGINPRVLRHILFQNVVLNRSAKLRWIHALLFGGCDVEAVQNYCGSVDRHRRRHFVERDTIEQNLHVGETRNRDAALSNFSFGSGVIGVVSHQRWKIECYRKASLPVREEELVALIRVASASESRELAHRPQLAAISSWMNSSRVWINAGHG